MNTVTGFNNIGAICWFNSLLQAIISCKCLCQTLNLSSSATDSTSNTAKELSILIYKLKELDDAVSVETSPSLIPNKSLDILKALIGDLRNNKRTIDWMGSGQQSSSEGLVLILEMLNNKKIDILFDHIYEIKTICNQTHKIISTVRDTGNIFYLWEFNEKRLLETSLEEMLLFYTEDCETSYIPDDYKKEHKDSYTYRKVYKLRRVPNVIIIALNRYKLPRNPKLKLPTEFSIPSNKNSNMVYRKIAEIDHLGSLHGGHYVCRAKRGEKVYLFNDSSFTEHKFETISSTYLTFYERG